LREIAFCEKSMHRLFPFSECQAHFRATDRKASIRLSPTSLEDINTLVKMGYVEIRGEKPALTASRLSEMDIGD
jgi:hypothetical protein